MSAQLVLAAIAALAPRVGFLYLAPFGRCRKRKGRGNIQRGRCHPVCPRCKGHRRIQRRGSRTVHRLAFRMRDGQRAAARTAATMRSNLQARQGGISGRGQRRPGACC